MDAPLDVVLLLAWATVVGIDLVSWPQGLLARPVVAGGITGLILGEPLAGFQVGAVLELFALDVLPVGASRYPDYGAATVAGVVAAAALPADAFGIGVGLGLLLAQLGGYSIALQRRLNTSATARLGALLAAGEAAAISRLHAGGLLRDALRSLALAMIALAAAALVAWLRPDPVLGRWLGITLTGAAVAAAGAGALRCAGRGLRLRWLAAGAVLGLLAVVTLG